MVETLWYGGAAGTAFFALLILLKTYLAALSATFRPGLRPLARIFPPAPLSAVCMVLSTAAMLSVFFI